MAEPVAIVGMGVLLPGAGSLEDYWRNLAAGVDAITDTPPGRWKPECYDPQKADQPSRLYCRRGGFVDELADFDPVAYGVMPASVAETEPEQLIALRVAAEAIEDAGGMGKFPDRERVGVIIGRLGQSSPTHIRFYGRVRIAGQLCDLVRELIPELPEHQLDRVRERLTDSLGPHHPENVIGLMPNLTASRIANRLDLRGPAFTVDAACASSLVAVDQSIAELASGRLDAVLAGGVHHNHDVTFWAVFSQLRALSRRGEIRPFDSAADGLLIGEGTGIVVLKRLSDARRDGNRIHAVIRGIGTSSDGRSASLVNPESSGQVIAVRRAWASAGLDPSAPDALGLLEAHGTATPVGDAAELTTMAEVFGPRLGNSSPVIGSVKSMIGHTMSTAGVAGLIKAVLAVSRGMLLPTLHCDNPRPELARTRFLPIAEARPWNGNGPRRAAVNAFGFGGINAHIIVEEVPDAPRPGRRAKEPARPTATTQVREPEQIVLLAGPDETALARLLDGDDREIRAHGIAAATHGPNGASPGGCRIGIVDPTTERLAASRKIVASGAPWRGGRDIWFSPSPLLAEGSGRIAFVFPGLEAELAADVGDVAAHFDLPAAGGGTDDFLGRFIEIIRLGRLLHEALGRMDIRPDAVAGHSIGDWTAGLVAGLIDESRLGDLATALFSPSLERTDLLHAVIGDSAEAVASRLAAFPGVAVSLDNAPSQSVVCGPVEQVTRLLAEFGRQGTPCWALPFASGFHTSYLQPLVEQLRPLADQQAVQPARMQVWSATIAAPLPADPVEQRRLFLRQLVEPVRFRSTITAMHDAGIRVFLQVGPGQLASLMHENLRGRDHLAIPVNVAFRSGLAQLHRVATALWVEGGTPDLTALVQARSAAPVTATRPGTPTGGLTMRLGLGSAGLSLGEGASELLGAVAVAAAPRAVSTPASGATALDALNHFARTSPATAELAAVLEDTAAAAVAVLSAAADHPRLRAHASHPAGGSGRDHRSVLRVGLDTMPYLADHALLQQPPDWPDMADRMVVMPATTIVRHMMDAVEALTPGMLAIQVRDAQFSRWVIAEPAQDVEITVRQDGPDEFTVAFGPYARAVIQTAAAYPAQPPPAWHHDPGTEGPTALGADRMYAARVMFHGPRYRSVTAIHAVGERHIRALLRTPAPPGALLDGGLQMTGNWMQVTLGTHNVAYPVGFHSIRFFGPAPAVSDPVECVGRLSSIDDSQITGSIQFAAEGRVWAQIDGCVSRRFYSHPQSRAVELAPGRNAIALRQPEGWVVVFDYWPDPASRNSVAVLMLGAREYLDYDQQPIARRRHWLLERIAVKDAVRFLMWDEEGDREIFPIEIRVHAGANGRARVAAWPDRAVPGCEAAFAHAGTAAVAIATAVMPGAPPGPPGLGIGMAEITNDPEGMPRDAFSAPELAVLRAVSTADPGFGHSHWLPRFRAAKQAAAHAQRTEPPGAAPGLVTVTDATSSAITVTASGHTHQVSHREIRTPDGMPERRYIVAWTWGADGRKLRPGMQST